MKLTSEQKKIIESVENYKIIKINAFAGSGKTTTLKFLADHYISKRILYIAFNSAVKKESADIFPKNVFVKTTHGLAFSAIKQNTSLKLDNIKNYKPADISNIFNIDYNDAVAALKIFESFCNNTQLEIQNKDQIHNVAKKIFDHMLLGKLEPTHGFYLKYYFLLLKNEQIRTYSYDLILLDEAQDTNEVTLGIFENLKSKTKVLVGDLHQQIYSFRGSRNILEKIKVNKTFYLSRSFRFNERIASDANILLEKFKNEKIKIKTGAVKASDVSQTCAFLSRTNGTLIAKIANRIENRKPFVTVRDPNEIFSLTCDLYYFLNKEFEKIEKNIFLKNFSDIKELEEYSKEVDDYELKSALKIVDEYKSNIFELKQIALKFYNAWKNKEKNGFINRIEEILFLSTAHTAKGLEWDIVEVADDFIDFAEVLVKLGCDSYKEYFENFSTFKNNDLIDEFNLFYVAITRAKKSLLKSSVNFSYFNNSLDSSLNDNIKKLKRDKI